MANALKHIKKVRSTNEVNSMQLLFEFVLGDKMPSKYDPEKTYNPREFVVQLNEVESKYEILMCIARTSGEFDSSKWNKISIKDYINKDQISLGSSKQLIKISEEIPTEVHNRVWMKPLAYKNLNTEIIENGSMMIIFDGDEFRGQDDMPEEENVKIWFDYEFDYESGLPQN